MTDTSQVKLSVVVPVRNRRDLLAKLLGALDEQTRRDFEVIVIDDGSDDGADRLAESWTVAGRPVRLLRSQGQGAVVARTIGVRAAAGEILAFTDSDCIPQPGWLEHGARAIEAGADMVNGLTLPVREMGPMERSVSSATEGLYPTANMFFRRAAFDSVGGFDVAADERLGFRHDELARGTGFGEDTILAWKVIRAGYRAEHVPAAEVRHHVFPPDVRDSLSRCLQVAAFPALVREVPELRQTIMRRGVLFGARSRAPFYATATSLLLQRRFLALAAFLWWVGVRARDMRNMPGPLADKLRYLPAEMTIDALMGVSMIVGSVRARTVAL